jgi:hypothetical protein
MAKKTLQLNDFSGGANSVAEPRDIKDNEFAQLWNVNTSQTGLIKTGGALFSSIAGLPHDNTNYQSGYGLFSTGTDYSISLIDGEFETGFEEGTVAAYEESGDASITLATVPSIQSITDHASDNFYNNYIILIASGNGIGQTRRITNYTGSTKVADLDSAFDTDPNTSSTYKIFRWVGDGTNFGDNAASSIDILDIGGASSYSNDDIDTYSNNNITGRFLRTKNTAADNQSIDLGWVTYNPKAADSVYNANDSDSTTIGATTLKAGVEYILSFYCRTANQYYNYVSDTSYGERVPFLQLYSDSVTDGTNTGLYLFQAENGIEFMAGADSTYEYADDITKNYVNNGDFEQSGSSATGGTAHSPNTAQDPPTEWKGYDYTGTITTSYITSSQFGGEGNTLKILPDANFAFSNSADGLSPNCFIYQELTLPDNHWYELFFAYSTANVGMTFAVIDAGDLTASGVYINLADTASTGSVTVAVQDEDDDGSATAYATNANLLNRMVFDVDGNFIGISSTVNSTIQLTMVGGVVHATDDTEQLYYANHITPWRGVGESTESATSYKYIGYKAVDDSPKPYKFFVPKAGTPGTPKKILLCFSGAAASTDVRIDGITVKKSYPDLTSMALEYGLDSPYSDSVKSWNKYTCKFKIPSEYNDATDWVLRLNAGSWGYQSGVSAGNEASQTVYFDAIRLEAVQNDNLTFLNDNTSTNSKVMIHSSNSNSWIENDLSWSGKHMMPVYNYINGMVKISDANFNNGNRGKLFYFIDYSKLSGDFKYVGYRTSNQMLCPPPNTIATFNSDNKFISTTFDALSYAQTYTYTDDDAATTPQQIAQDTDVNWLLNKLITSGRVTFYQESSRTAGRLFLEDGTTQLTEYDGHSSSVYPFYTAWAGDDNTANDMGSISGVGNVAKVEFTFTYDTMFSFRDGADAGDAWNRHPHPAFEVTIGKMGADLFNASGSPIEDTDRYKLGYGDIASTELLNGVMTHTFESNDMTINTYDDMANLTWWMDSTDWPESEVTTNYLYDKAVNAVKTFKGTISLEDSSIAATDDMIMKFDVLNPWLRSHHLYNSEDADDDWNFPRYERVLFSSIRTHFLNTNWSAGADGLSINQRNFTKANLRFGTPEGATAVGWEERVFKLATTSVNIFDEESNLNITANTLGANDDDASTIASGTCPTVNVYIGDEVAKEEYRKKIKYYMQDTESNIWYLQFYVDLEKNKIYSTTSNYSSTGTKDNTNKCYTFIIPKEKMLNYNEVDSYESQTLVNQEIAETSVEKLICDYKTAVVLNNRLYVGNIRQNGRVYGDRMIKSPIGKYNVLPSSNFIDVAINDGDEITALAYYKDKLLQFKKRKVFVINTSGDYEFLEDTFKDIGVNFPCEVTTTPYGIAWINTNGCFIYDGSKLTNLIDDKMDNKASTSPFDANFWRIGSWTSSVILQNQSMIGYNNQSKDLVIRTYGSNTAAINNISVASRPDGYIYNMLTKGWYLTHKAFTGKMHLETKGGVASNFVTNSDGKLIQYMKSDVSNTTHDINHIMKWEEELGNDVDLNDQLGSTNSDNTRSLYIITKDFDFGDYAAKKNIYKVYVTFKSLDKDGAYQASGVKVYFSDADGAKSWTEFDNTSTDYDQTNGLNDTSASSTAWITAELKINNNAGLTNRRSIQLRFYSGAPAVGFQINDITIVYRIKSPR